LWLSKGSLLELSLSREVSFLCDWATCNLTLHFSGTLLGSARGIGLLPVCGRNLYNCLCSLFLCSITFLSAAQDSELTQTLNLFRLWTWEQFLNERETKFLKHTIQPPPALVVFLTFNYQLSNSSLQLSKSVWSFYQEQLNVENVLLNILQEQKFILSLQASFWSANHIWIKALQLFFEVGIKSLVLFIYYEIIYLSYIITCLTLTKNFLSELKLKRVTILTPLSCDNYCYFNWYQSPISEKIKST